MGNFKKPSIDKKIAAKMFDSTKLSRMREREIMKKERERKLLTLKRSTLPIIETDFIRSKDSKCNKCNKEKETYGITFEWYLEPINVLDDDKGFYGFSKYSSTKRMLSKITNGIVIQPAKIKIMKYLQEKKSEIPMIYVLKSRDPKLDEILLNFILETYNIDCPMATTRMDEVSMQSHLDSHKSLILFIDDDFQLNNIIKCIKYGELKDIYMMPVSINYEIQQSAAFKQPCLSVLPKNFYQNYGIVKINFNEPYKCSELLQWINEDDKTEKSMKEAIEGHLLYDIVYKRPVFSTNIFAFVLLTYFRKNGGTIEEIASKIDDIRNELTLIDFSFDGNAMDVAIYAVTKLNNKIIINESLIIKPIEDSAVLIELWDYAETLICHFTLQSILILSAEHFKRTDSYIDYNHMIDLAMDFCEILHLEIPLYKPCNKIKDQLHYTFDILSGKDFMSKPSVVTYTENEKRAQKIAKYFDDFDEYDESEYSDEYSESDDLDPSNEVKINIEKQAEINFLKDVVLPIQESYMNVAYTLKHLIGNKVMNEAVFLYISMDAMIVECSVGNCKYWESCSIKWMKNCLKLFELWGVIGRANDSYFLTEKYNSEKAVQKVMQHIDDFSDY